MEGNDVRTKVMTMGQWLVTMIITAIPLVGLIMLFVWAFSSTENQNKANWAKAALILTAIVIVLYIVIIVVVMGVFMSSGMSMDSYQ